MSALREEYIIFQSTFRAKKEKKSIDLGMGRAED